LPIEVNAPVPSLDEMPLALLLANNLPPE